MATSFYKTSLALFFTLLLFTTQSSQAQYCVDNLYSYGCYYDYINNVSVSNVNQTNTGCGNNGYSDFTNLTVNLDQGSTNSITVNMGNYGEYVCLWIDFNDDYNFDATEKLVSNLYCSNPNTDYTANFYVPPFVALGDHRMRLRCVQYTYPFDACSNYYSGEVHDYTAHILAPTAMQYISSTTTQDVTTAVQSGNSDEQVIGIQVVAQGSLSPINATSFTLNDNGTTNFDADVTGVKIYYTGSSSSFSTNNLFGSASNTLNPITGTQQLVAGTNYFWVAYDMSSSATILDYIDAECTSLTVGGSSYTPSITAPAGNRQVGYCTPINTNSCYYAYIDGVELNTLSNTFSYCNGNMSGYILYDPIGNLTTSLEQGSTYPITLTGNLYEYEGFGVWIDFNNDGDFDDEDEFAWSSPYINLGQQLGSIAVPSSATIGDHRMRVRCKDYGTVFSSESCSSYYAGETEDYTITITEASSMVFASSTTTQNNTGALTLGSTDQEIIGIKVNTQGSLDPFDLTSLTINSNGSTNFADDVTNVKVYFTGSSPAFATTTLFGSTTDLTNPITGTQTLSSGDNYFWVAYDINSTGHMNDYLDAECTQIEMTGNGGTQVPDVTAPAGNRQINYCFPSNVYGCYWGYIDGVVFNTLSNSPSGCNGNVNSYIEYDASQFTTTVEAGGTYPITITSGSTDYDGFGVWIDFNNDGDFDDSGEFPWSSPYAINGPQYGSIAVPSDATIGDHRMRIRSKYYSNVYSYESCGETYNNGESEDYTISITPPSDMTYVSSTTTQTVTSNISSGTVDQQVIGIEVITQGSLNPFSVSSITVNNNGTTDPGNDVTNYKIYYTGNSPTFATTTLFGSATDIANPITGTQALQDGINYFWLAYDISSSANMGDFIDGECTQIAMTGNGGTQVPSITAPAGNREINYCIGDFQYGCYYNYIDGVILNTLSNTFTYCNGNANGYIEYPQSGNTTTQLDMGQSYSLELDGSYGSGTGFGVWIDLNGDGDFDDADEFVYQSPYYMYGPQYGTLTVPCNDAYVGDRRMRVRAFYYSIPYSYDACTYSYYGETEDYTITLSPSVTQVFNSSTCTQDNQNPVSLNATDVEILGIQVNTTGCNNPMSATSFTLNYNGSTDFLTDVSNVKVYYTGTSSVFSPVNLFGSSTDLSSAVTGSQQLSSGINYFWVAYDISGTAAIGDYIDAECTSINLTSQGDVTPSVTAPAGNRLINYCVGDFAYGCYFNYIDGVILNTLSNTFTYCNGNANGYILYPQTGNTTTSLELGSSYSLELDGSYGSGTGFGVWIDYNGDGDFDDADEFVYQSPYYQYGPQYGTISLPCTDAYVGDRRMRVRAFYYSVPYSYDACTYSYYGETEDYTITLSPPPPNQIYNSSTCTQNNTSVVGLNTPDVEILGVQVVTAGCNNPLSATSFTINGNGSTDFSGDVTNVKIYYTGTSSTFSTATLFGSSTDLSSPVTGSQELSVGVNYFWVAYDVSATGSTGDYIDAECTSINLTSQGDVTPDVTAPFGNRQINYCIGQSSYGCYWGYIDDVEINTLSHPFSGCNGNYDGYVQYDPSSYTTALDMGTTYNASLTGGPSYDYVGFGVWIDYNNDNDFDDAGEFVWGSPSSNYGTQNFSFTVPISPDYVGERRMRIRSREYTTMTSGDACTYFYYSYGETEDYTITLNAPPACTGVPVAGTITADPVILCDPGNTATMDLTGYSLASDLTFEWQSSSDGINFSTIPGATSTSYSETLNSTTYYRVNVTCSNSNESATSDAALVKVGGDEQITSTTGAEVCGEGNITISATSNSDYVMWYNSETDVVPAYYSSSPSDYSPFVNTTTTFYAAAADGQVNTGNVGPTDNTIGPTNQYYTYNYELFDVLKPCTVVGIYVYPASAGTVAFTIYDGFWNYVGSISVPVTQDQVNQKTYIPINMAFNVGTQYKLYWTYPSVNLYSNDYTGTPYPYPYTLNDAISITNSSYGNYYYFYAYDWVIDYSQLCVSPKTPVTITVTPSAEVDVTTDPPSATICNGSGQTVSLAASGGGYTSFTWSPADGLSSTSGATVSASPTETTSYYVTATDGSCTNIDTVVVNVVDPPNVTVTASPDAVCNGGSSQLLVTSPATSYTVSQIDFDPVEYNGGTIVPLSIYQVSNALSIGFNFNFYGNDYTQFYLSANAWLSFDYQSYDYSSAGQHLPDPTTPNNLIAFAWAFYYPPQGGTIRYFTTGTAPFRKCVIEFKDIQHYYSGDPITVQTVLYETTNVIEIHTTSMPGNPSDYYWEPHTEGIENGTGTEGLTVPGRNADATWTASNDAWRFAPSQYQYEWNPSGTVNDATIFNPVATPSSTTTYTVTVTDNITLCSIDQPVTVSMIQTPVPGTVTPDVSEYCGAGDAFLSVTDYSPGATFQWQESSTPGGPYSDIPGATDNTYTTPSINSTTYYVAELSCAGSATSGEASVIVDQPPVSPTAIDGGNCGPGSVILGAQSAGNGELNWYVDANGSGYLGSGTPFTTPFIDQTTTYYVSEGAPVATPLTTLLTGFYSSNGNMFDITALNDVFITGFDINMNNYYTSDIEVYYKPGTYVGSEVIPSNWTLVGIAPNITGGGYNVATPLNLSLYVHIPAGQTGAFYITCGNYYSYLSNQYGTSVGNVYVQDNNIQVKEGAAVYYPFSYAYTPYVWDGVVHYVAPGCASPLVPVTAQIYQPQVAASVSDATICEGTNITLTAVNNGNGNFTYEWMPQLPGMIPPNGLNDTVTVTPSVTTTFTVSVTDPLAPGCDTTIIVPVTVNPSPAVFISNLDPQYYVNEPAFTLDGIPPGGTFSGPGVNGNQFDPSSLPIGGPYTVTYTYTDANGCTGSYSQNVNIVPIEGIGGVDIGRSLSFYPNPSEGVFNMRMKLPVAVQSVVLTVNDIVGRHLFVYDFGAAQDEINANFDFSTWAKGSYYVTVDVDGQQYYRKITIQ